MPHTTTQVLPSELLFHRVIRGGLPILNKNKFVNRHDEVRENEAKKQAYNKQYADKRRNAKWSEIGVGDRVLVQQRKKNKLSTRFNKTPYVVTHRHGSQMPARNRDDHCITRNVYILKRFQTFWRLRPMTTMTIDNHNNNTDNCNINNNNKDKDKDHHYVDQLDCFLSQ